MKNILDKSFRYVPSAETDVAKTIAREIKRLREEEKKKAEELERISRNVKPFARRV